SDHDLVERLVDFGIAEAQVGHDAAPDRRFAVTRGAPALICTLSGRDLVGPGGKGDGRRGYTVGGRCRGRAFEGGRAPEAEDQQPAGGSTATGPESIHAAPARHYSDVLGPV